MKEIFFKELKERLDKREIYEADNYAEAILASVMMLMRNRDDNLELLFIKRPDNPGDAFSGHIAFPGGKKKDNDTDLLETAIRETREEVGINVRDSARILGKLDYTRPNSKSAGFIIVTPYVSFLTRDVEIRTNEEVDEYMWIPLDHLMDDRNMRVRTKVRNDVYIDDYVFSYDKYIIWGMTGRVLKKFIDEFAELLNQR